VKTAFTLLPFIALALICLFGLAFGESPDPRCGIIAKASESYRDSIKHIALRAMAHNIMIEHEDKNLKEFFGCQLIKICNNEYYCIEGTYTATESNPLNLIEERKVFYLDTIQKYFK